MFGKILKYYSTVEVWLIKLEILSKKVLFPDLVLPCCWIFNLGVPNLPVRQQINK